MLRLENPEIRAFVPNFVLSEILRIYIHRQKADGQQKQACLSSNPEIYSPHDLLLLKESINLFTNGKNIRAPADIGKLNISMLSIGICNDSETHRELSHFGEKALLPERSPQHFSAATTWNIKCAGYANRYYGSKGITLFMESYRMLSQPENGSNAAVACIKGRWRFLN